MKVPVATAWQLPAVNGVRFSGPPPGPPPVDPEPPPVEGWEHGSTVTLTPAMFGLATFGDDPNMRLFDTVDNQSSYDALADNAIIPVGASYPWGRNTTWGNPATIERAGGIARHAFDSSRYRINGKSYLGLPTSFPYGHSFQRKMFIAWWQRMDAPVTSSGSNKILRAWADSSGNRRYISWTNGSCYAMRFPNFWSSAIRPMTEWTSHACYVDCTSAILSEWRSRWYVNGQLVEDRYAHDAPDPTSTSSFNTDLDWPPPVPILLGWDPAVSADWIDGRFTDIYLSVSPKRFLLSSAPTLAVGENQEIVSWSPSSVQIRVFHGATTPTHLHFINDHNAPTGSPIEIGVV